MFNPHTHQLMPIYSQPFLTLLDEVFTEEELLKMRVDPHTNIPLTYDPDLDLQIMLHLNNEDLESLCQVNQYTQDLCHRDYFWIQKIEQTGFDKNTGNILNVNYKKLYYSIIQTQQKFDLYGQSYTYLNIPNKDKLNLIFSTLNIPIILKKDLSQFDTFHNELYVRYDRIPLTKEQISVLFIYLHYFDLIKST